MFNGAGNDHEFAELPRLWQLFLLAFGTGIFGFAMGCWFMTAQYVGW